MTETDGGNPEREPGQPERNATSAGAHDGTRRRSDTALRLWLPIGVALGLSLGQVGGNLGTGLALGIGCGVAVGAGIDAKKRREAAVPNA
ncbi:hypothetical protein ACFFKE_01795 [Streptomyces mutabilis]|uniref:hypothetical protein n=1 Tax=Streptomyces mutabilis TaxID=67332 RepID=UPI00177B6B90|nr:hypothetical protein [Streptomyces mutabilis]GGP99877.1 hypothetical protein GCM10010279_03390 [Streptomyces mutabilis]